MAKDIKTIAVIGPNADNFESLIGNYNGIPKDPVTVLKGIINKVGPDTKVIYADGSDLAEGIHNLTVIPSRYLPDRLMADRVLWENILTTGK